MKFPVRRLNYLNVKPLLIFIFSIFNLIFLPYVSELQAINGSLRYHGNGGDGSSTEVDRVKIKIDQPAKSADIGTKDFTLEFWMRAAPGANSDEGSCIEGSDGWIEGVIMFDRDVFGAGDFGDYGISLFNNGIAFGAAKGSNGAGICSSQNLSGNPIDLEDNEWHHVAVTRRSSDGQMRIFIDGLLKAEGFGPTGNISYRNDRSTSYPNSDPYLVIGAEKHNLLGYPSFNGWIDEVRLSNTIRYTTNFIRPVLPFSTDSNTKVLYHFSEGSGNTINDSSGALFPSTGRRKFGGSPPGPEWSLDHPFWPRIQLNQVVSGLTSPVYLTHAGDGSGRIFIVEQPGRILILQGLSINSTPFLDITPIVLSGGEQGLLSIAFSPNYSTNGLFYVYYTDLNGNNVVARYSRSSGDPDLADPTSAQILLTLNHPGQSNHNGGQLAFGPEGYLYIGPGDGGGGGDPNNNAQNKNSLLGKILRIIVEDDESGNPLTPYQIPANNPFVGVSGRDEIWALGLRNPWRFSFDVHPQSLKPGLYIGDVGQGLREEINFENYPGLGGRNYGWSILEGSLCFKPASNCNIPSNYNAPKAEYDHADGRCSVTGGYVYRGTQYPRMQGTYFFGDYCNGKIWGLKKGTSWTKILLLDSFLSISSFGTDENGNLYVVHHDSGGISGAIYKVTDVPSSS